MIDAVCVALLLGGSAVAVPWRDGRYLHYVFSFVAFEAFLALGPRAAWLVLGAGAAGVLGHVAWSRMRPPAPPGSQAVARSLGATTVASAAGMLASDVLVRRLGTGYPVPVATLGDLVRFSALLACLFATSALAKAALLRVLAGDGTRPVPEGESGSALYSIGAVVGAPMHYAAHPLLAHGWTGAWVAATGWAFLLNEVLRRELDRDRRAQVLVRELARKERLSAVGEVTARIVHQTRHQLGLIGISAHRIGKRAGALSGDDARVVHEELAKLDEVQRELAEMLTSDLRDASRPALAGPALTYSDVVAAVVKRLGALAETRGVRLELGPIEPAAAARPANAENVSHGLFNVIENALAVARAVVRVDATRRGGTLVISVLDDGPGLEPAVLDRATEPFFTTKTKGTGMGLAIARAAFEEEGAALHVANRPQGGCAVEIAVPARPLME